MLQDERGSDSWNKKREGQERKAILVMILDDLESSRIYVCTLQLLSLVKEGLLQGPIVTEYED